MKKKLGIILIMIVGLLFFPDNNTFAKDFSVDTEYYRVSNADAKNTFPYSSVVRLAGPGRCTGTVVGKDYVLTASHCVRAVSANVYDNSGKQEGHFSINREESYYSPHNKANKDYAILKMKEATIKGKTYHIGEFRKPLTILGYSTTLQGKNGSLLGFPSKKYGIKYNHVLFQQMVNIDYWKNDEIRGRFAGGGGGMSGGPLLNNQGQIEGVYHGSSGGNRAWFTKVSIATLLKESGIRDETSRIYIWKNQDVQNKMRGEINPEGLFIEQTNNTIIDMKELLGLANQSVESGYKVDSVTNGISTYDQNSNLRMFIGGLNLYPKDVTPIKYNVSFNKNADDATGDMRTQQFTYDKKQELSTNEYKRAGYVFEGWNDKADGTGTTYTDKESISNLTVSDGETVTLYAKWLPSVQNASVSYIDDTTGNILETAKLTGAYGTTDSYRTADKIAEFSESGYEFISDNYPVEGVNYDQVDVLQTFEVHLKHTITLVEDKKSVTQTIHYLYEDNQLAADDYTAKIEFKRLNAVDNVTKLITPGDWSTDAETTFKAVKSPVISGYKADKDEIVEVSGISDSTADIEETVTYTKSSNSMQRLLLYRLYNSHSGEHFYTLSEKEKYLVEAAGWTDEEAAWVTPSIGDDVYRLYNPNGGEHLYTMDNLEYDSLATKGWIKEGIAFRSSIEKLVPIYRSYNPNNFANNHLYTESILEHNWLVGLGWKEESIAFYSLK